MSLMSNNFKEEIMDQSRHQFIYGYNTDERTKQIKEMVKDYPIKIGESSPMGIYLENHAITSEKTDHNIDKMLASRMSQEYLCFSIAYTLLDKALDDNDFSAIPQRVSTFLTAINQLLIDQESANVKSLQELLQILKMGLNFYQINYNATVETGSFTGHFSDIPMSFMSLDVFIKYFKKMLNNNSYVAVIVDLKNPISSLATQAINEYLTKRCNADLSMKVVCEPGAWATYYDFSGIPVEYIHDYGTVELDESHQKCLENIKSRYMQF